MRNLAEDLEKDARCLHKKACHCDSGIRVKHWDLSGELVFVADACVKFTRFCSPATFFSGLLERG